MTHKNQNAFEFGVYTFGELLHDPISGKIISAEERMENIIATAKLADELGLDVFGLGEHHRLDFSVSATSVVLAAIAQATNNIRLTSATTVLGTADPVIVFEDFATVDVLSKGRAEIIAGRGAFTESFPLFGYTLDDYDELFEEKLQLLQLLNKNERVTWTGKFRSPLNGNEIAPRPIQDEIPIWRGVGGTLESARRAGKDGLGMVLTILGGSPNFGKPLVDMYRTSGLAAGHPVQSLTIAIASHGYIAATREQAIEEFYPYYANYIKSMMRRYLPKSYVESATDKNDALAVGSPEDIVKKIVHQYELFRHQRHFIQIDICQPFDYVERALTLYATEVVPAVKKEISTRFNGAD